MFYFKIKELFHKIDFILVFSLLPIIFAGFATMKSFGEQNTFSFGFFEKQIIWVCISFFIFFIFSFIDFRFLKKTNVLVALFLFFSILLVVLLFFGKTVSGSKSWFDFGFFSFQPVDLMKIVLILVLAKYFSRRHVEIKNIKHLFISGVYVFIPFILIFLQPDFGSAMIILFIWVGMVFISGISKKHLAIVFMIGVLTFGIFWSFVFKDYQKNRIINFFNPVSDIHGSGYNVFQSTVAVGSGQFLGKGLGMGTQSRLRFLPEPQTDFIFASFAEEWGFVGSCILILLFGIVIWRILYIASLGATNFEMLFGMGLAIFFMSHIIINIGMNIGILPVTGIPLPFMSYGGSHLLAEFIGLGILMGMHRYSRGVHRDDLKKEFLGI